jgi:hypothetical protein
VPADAVERRVHAHDAIAMTFRAHLAPLGDVPAQAVARSTTQPSRRDRTAPPAPHGLQLAVRRADPGASPARGGAPAEPARRAPRLVAPAAAAVAEPAAEQEQQDEDDEQDGEHVPLTGLSVG